MNIKKSTVYLIGMWAWLIVSIGGYVWVAVSTYEPLTVEPVTTTVVENGNREMTVEHEGKQFTVSHLDMGRGDADILQSGQTVEMFIDPSSATDNPTKYAFGVTDDGRYLYGSPNPHIEWNVFIRLLMAVPWAFLVIGVSLELHDKRKKINKRDEKNGAWTSFSFFDKGAYLNNPALTDSERSNLLRARNLIVKNDKRNDQSLVEEFDYDVKLLIDRLAGVERQGTYCRSNDKSCICDRCTSEDVHRQLIELANTAVRIFRRDDQPLAFLQVLQEFEERKKLEDEATKELDELSPLQQRSV